MGLGPNGVKPCFKNVELTDSISHSNKNIAAKTIICSFCSVWPCWFPYAVIWQRLLVLILMALPVTCWGKIAIGEKKVSAFLVWKYESMDRYKLYTVHHMPLTPHPLISFSPVCMPGAGNALKAFVRDIGEGVHASMLQWSQLWLNWSWHEMIMPSLCVTVSFRIRVKKMKHMHNSICRIACTRIMIMVPCIFPSKRKWNNQHSMENEPRAFSTRWSAMGDETAEEELLDLLSCHRSDTGLSLMSGFLTPRIFFLWQSFEFNFHHWYI